MSLTSHFGRNSCQYFGRNLLIIEELNWLSAVLKFGQPNFYPMKSIWIINTREFLKCDIACLDGGIHDRNTIHTITIGITICIWTRQNHIFVIVKFYFAAFTWKFAVSEHKNHCIRLIYEFSEKTVSFASPTNCSDW